MTRHKPISDAEMYDRIVKRAAIIKSVWNKTPHKAGEKPVGMEWAWKTSLGTGYGVKDIYIFRSVNSPKIMLQITSVWGSLPPTVTTNVEIPLAHVSGSDRDTAVLVRKIQWNNFKNAATEGEAWKNTDKYKSLEKDVVHYRDVVRDFERRIKEAEEKMNVYTHSESAYANSYQKKEFKRLCRRTQVEATHLVKTLGEAAPEWAQIAATGNFTLLIPLDDAQGTPLVIPHPRIDFKPKEV